MEQFIRRCEFCLRVDRANGACPRCGYNGERHNTAYMLREGTWLTPRYMLGHNVGQGGFSICYRAWDEQAGEIVAIKELFLPDQRSSRWEDGRVEVSRRLREPFEAAKRGLRHEAKVLTKLQDEIGIVKIRDYFEANDTAYLVTDYLRGLSYATHLQTQYNNRKKMHLAIATAVDVAIRLLDSLQSLHNRNLLHLDVKPTNIQVMDDNRIMLLDLGSARDVFRDPSSGWTGAYTLGFSAPEQFSHDGEVEPWTDVYAVAATLYYSLSLAVPSWANLRLKGEALTPLSHHNPAVPPELDQVIETAMQLEASARYPSAAAFVAALQPFGSEPEPVLRYASKAQRVLLGLVDAACGLAVAAVIDLILRLPADSLGALSFLVCCLLLQIVLPSIWDVTPGMAVFGLHLQSTGGGRPHTAQLITRAYLTCLIFFLLLSWQADGSMWHDRVTGTRVVQQTGRPHNIKRFRKRRSLLAP